MPRRIGFELEMTPCYEDYEEFFESCVTAVAGQSFEFGSESADHWNLKDEHTGLEFTSPALASSPDNFRKIGDVIDNIRRRFREENVRCVVESGCGFHVHIQVDDLRPRQLRNMMRMFIHFERALLSLQPQYRSRANHVTLLRRQNAEISNNTNVIENFFNHSTAVNFGRFNQRSTIEIRWGSSTTRRRNVIGWIQLLVFMVRS